MPNYDENFLQKVGYLFRSLIFYLGYAIVIALLGIFAAVLGPLLPLSSRYYVLTRFNCFTLWWAKVVCGIEYVLEGEENIPNTPCVVISNHQSAWETYYLGLLFSPQATVLKQELLVIPFFGWALKMLHPIAINRSKPAAALRQIMKQGKERLNEGLWVVIFPEGTRVRPGKTERFNKGGVALACHAKVSVLPIAHNAGKCWPAGSMIKRPGVITVKIGSPVETRGASRDEVHLETESWIRETSSSL